jgi:hypothetical protein
MKQFSLARCSLTLDFKQLISNIATRENLFIYFSEKKHKGLKILSTEAAYRERAWSGRVEK